MSVSKADFIKRTSNIFDVNMPLYAIIIKHIDSDLLRLCEISTFSDDKDVIQIRNYYLNGEPITLSVLVDALNAKHLTNKFLDLVAERYILQGWKVNHVCKPLDIDSENTRVTLILYLS